MPVDLLAVVGLAQTGLDVAQKTELYAPFCLKPLAQAALEVVDEVAQLRRAMEDVLGYAVDAWNETDIDGNYQTAKFKEAIERALALLPDMQSGGKKAAPDLPPEVVDDLLGFPPPGRPIVSGSGCDCCGALPGNLHWSNCAIGAEEAMDASGTKTAAEATAREMLTSKGFAAALRSPSGSEPQP